MTQCCLTFVGSNGRRNASPAMWRKTHLDSKHLRQNKDVTKPTLHPLQSVHSLTFFQHKSSVNDLPVSLVTLPLGHFLFTHHPPGTHCLDTSALLTNYQPSNVNWSLTSSSPFLPSSYPAPVPQIRLIHDFDAYEFLCMHVYIVFRFGRCVTLSSLKIVTSRVKWVRLTSHSTHTYIHT